jgi:uncharacterized membrane protein YphA (DoxX/SURF4 family)
MTDHGKIYEEQRICKRMKQYAPMLVRYAVGTVFLILGIMQLLDPAGWLGYVPAFVPIDADLAVLLNGTFDTALGLLLILGFFVRIVAAVAAIHLIGITATLGWNDITVRDLGLSLATIAVALQGQDEWCVPSLVRARR